MAAITNIQYFLPREGDMIETSNLGMACLPRSAKRFFESTAAQLAGTGIGQPEGIARAVLLHNRVHCSSRGV
jgi:hypothetical protein